MASRQPTRSHVRKCLLTNMEFNMVGNVDSQFLFHDLDSVIVMYRKVILIIHQLTVHISCVTMVKSCISKIHLPRLRCCLKPPLERKFENESAIFRFTSFYWAHNFQTVCLSCVYKCFGAVRHKAICRRTADLLKAKLTLVFNNIYFSNSL